MALIGSQPVNEMLNEDVQLDTHGCSVILDINKNVLRVECNEHSNLGLNESKSDEMIKNFLKLNKIEKIESIRATWCEAK